MLATLLPFVQIALAVLLAILVLVQQSDAGLGSAFGGQSGGTLHRTRRGFERILFIATIVVALLFILSALGALLL